MKTLTGCLLPLLILAAPGCLQLPSPWHQRKPAPAPAPVAAKPVRRPAPVTPEQVTEANAHAQADALEAEMAREEPGETSALPAGSAVQKTR
jgi:hypothetical protein